MIRILGAGDNVVDRYPALGLYFPGGNALNVAVAAKRAGANTAYLGVVGDDEAGRVVLDALRSEGVSTERVRVAHGPNAWADVVLDGGDRVFVDGSVEVSPFRMTDEDLAYAATFDLVHTCAGGFLEEDLSAIGRVAAVSFDFKSHRDPAYLDPLLGTVRVASFSASDLAEDETIGLLEHATGSGAEVAVATRGRGGALALDHGRLRFQPSVATHVVDTLGAGDSFIARFLVGYLGGEDRGTTLAAAAEEAARTCASYGAFGYGHRYAPREAPTWSGTRAAAR